MFVSGCVCVLIALVVWAIFFNNSGDDDSGYV